VKNGENRFRKFLEGTSRNLHLGRFSEKIGTGTNFSPKGMKNLHLEN
jgi:hypothetical protein